MDWISSHPQLIFYLVFAIAIILSRIPLAGKYFRSVNTLVHEAGHAFFALLLSGEVIAINLFADTSGSTVTKSKSKIAQVFIALAGYPVSTLSGLLFLLLLAKGYYLAILFVLTSIALIIMILSLKNAYGLFWAGTFVVLNLLLIYFNSNSILYVFAAFYTLIIFTDSIFSSLILLLLTIKQPKKAGDATNLHKITKIPAMVWAILFLAFTLFISWLSIVMYFPPLTSLM